MKARGQLHRFGATVVVGRLVVVFWLIRATIAAVGDLVAVTVGNSCCLIRLVYTFRLRWRTRHEHARLGEKQREPV
jgi:hypothetical protein